MFENRQLTRCQQRKAVLLQQSAAQRRALGAEARNLRPLADWVDLGLAAVQKVRAGWEVLAPLLSLWRARTPESGSLVEKLAKGIALARSLPALWKKWF